MIFLTKIQIDAQSFKWYLRRMTKDEQFKLQGQIFKIQRYCLHDGPGIRSTVFFQGCPLKCQWCHNPESQVFANELSSGSTHKCYQYSINNVIKEIEQDLIFFDQSQGGVTFSGGEPLSQPEFLLSLIRQCKKKEIHTCLDTSGYAQTSTFKSVCQKIDMVLFDIKLVDDRLHEKYTGASFKPVLKNLKALTGTAIDVKIRVPLIPGITDTNDNINGIISLLTSIKKFKDVYLLPFHNTGEGKYEKLGEKNKLKGIKPCSKTKTDEISRQFKKNGFNINIGG